MPGGPLKANCIIKYDADNYKGRDTRCDKSPRLHCCCNKSLALSLSLRYVAQIQTSLNLCDRSQRQNSVAATMIFTCHTRRFVAATCRGDVSQRFVATCVSAFKNPRCLNLEDLGLRELASYYRITLFSWRDILCPLNLGNRVRKPYIRPGMVNRDHYILM